MSTTTMYDSKAEQFNERFHPLPSSTLHLLSWLIPGQGLRLYAVRGESTNCMCSPLPTHAAVTHAQSHNRSLPSSFRLTNLTQLLGETTNQKGSTALPRHLLNPLLYTSCAHSWLVVVHVFCHFCAIQSLNLTFLLTLLSHTSILFYL